MRGAFALSLAVAVVASGCTFEPSAHLAARPGDFVLLTVGAWHDGRLVWGNLAANASVDEDLPDVPRAWSVMATTEPVADVPGPVREGLGSDAPGAALLTLPPGLIASMSGHGEGDTVEATLPPALAFGPRLGTSVVVVARNDTIPRVVHVSASDAPWAATGAARGAVRPFLMVAPGADWNATLVRPDADGFLVRLEDPPPTWKGVALLAHPTHCTPARCLFLSRLTGWNSTHLQVYHEARLGDESSFFVTARVAALDDDNVTIDYNHPLAGLVLQVKVRIHRIVPPVTSGAWRAPLFEARDLDGGTFRLADHLDRPVLLEFFATWCPSCIVNARDRLPELRERWGDRVVFVSVNVDPFETDAGVREFVETYGVDWVVVPDGAGIASQYRVGTLSTDVLIGPGGDVAYVGTGEADVDRLDDEIAQALEARPA